MCFILTSLTSGDIYIRQHHPNHEHASLHQMMDAECLLKTTCCAQSLGGDLRLTSHLGGAALSPFSRLCWLACCH